MINLLNKNKNYKNYQWQDRQILLIDYKVTETNKWILQLVN